MKKYDFIGNVCMYEHNHLHQTPPSHHHLLKVMDVTSLNILNIYPLWLPEYHNLLHAHVFSVSDFIEFCLGLLIGSMGLFAYGEGCLMGSDIFLVVDLYCGCSYLLRGWINQKGGFGASIDTLGFPIDLDIKKSSSLVYAQRPWLQAKLPQQRMLLLGIGQCCF